MSTDATDQAKRARRLLDSPQQTRQPQRPEVPGPTNAFYWAVVREIPGDDANYVEMQFVKPASDYSDTGAMEFVANSKRPVLLPGNMTADTFRGWLWEGAEDAAWTAAITPLMVFPAYGSLWVMPFARPHIIEEADDFQPSDCYRQGTE